jgi:hypothetical protein
MRHHQLCSPRFCQSHHWLPGRDALLPLPNANNGKNKLQAPSPPPMLSLYHHHSLRADSKHTG